MTMRPLFRVSRSYAAQARDGEWLSLTHRVWVMIALAVAFFVRVYALAAQSLWNDEGTSVALARTSLDAILNAAARDIHPPLYYFLLHFWIMGAGTSEFALRFLSVIAGVLVVALTFRIAREFFNQDVALIAAFLSALNPFQTYYAQETRMYVWVTLFACFSVWAMVRWLKPGLVESNVKCETSRDKSDYVLAGGATQSHEADFSDRWGITAQTGIAIVLFILATLAALYTNYYAFTLVLFENLAFVVWLILMWRRGARSFATLALWIGANLMIVLAYLPWLAFARASLTAWPGISEPMTLWDMTWRITSAFVTGADVLVNWQGFLVAIYALLFVVGLLPARDLFPQSGWGIALCALWASVPLLAMYVVSLSRPAYNPKFLLLATPGFLILVARGASVWFPEFFMRARASHPSAKDSPAKRSARSLIRSWKFLIGALFAVGTVLALQAMYTAPQLQRDDYRGIVNYLNAVATENDAVIVDAPGQMDVVRYYYRGAADLSALPIGRPMERAATQNVLGELSARENVYGIFWATEQADPERFVERALAETKFKANDDWHGNVRLTQYASAQTSDVTAFRTGVRFGDEIELEGYMYPAPPRVVEGFVPLELEWRPLKLPPGARYKVFAHLLDAQGHVIAQRDAEPQDGFSPTNEWTRDETIHDRIAIAVPPGLGPGEYRLIVGLYRGDTGERLSASSGGDSFTLGVVQIAKKNYSRDALLFTRAMNVRWDALELVGYEFQNDERGTFSRGEFIPLVLYFQAREKMTGDFKLDVQLRDEGGNVIAASRAFENNPTSRWDANEIVRDVQYLNIPPDAAPGEYRIVVNDGNARFEVTRVQIR